MVYLDNAATTQKPMAVLLASRHYYEAINANIHRGTHHLARLATETFENARQTVATYLNAASPDEVIFTSGTTDGINLVANVLGLSGRIKPGDEVLISTLEHHSNIVPWQMLCERTGAVLKVIPCDEDGTLDQDAFLSLLSERTKILSLTWISNSFGTVNPVAEMTAAAKKAGALVLIDAAQAVAHVPIDVQALGIDFLAFSGHKIYAPDRHRRALGPGGRAQLPAAVARRRRDDQGGHFRKNHLQRAAVQVRSRHAEHRGRHRPRCGDRFRERHRPEPDPGARNSAHPLRRRRVGGRFPGSASTAQPTGRARFPSTSRASTTTISAR